MQPPSTRTSLQRFHDQTAPTLRFASQLLKNNQHSELHFAMWSWSGPSRRMTATCTCARCGLWLIWLRTSRVTPTWKHGMDGRYHAQWTCASHRHKEKIKDPRSSCHGRIVNHNSNTGVAPGTSATVKRCNIRRNARFKDLDFYVRCLVFLTSLLQFQGLQRTFVGHVSPKVKIKITTWMTTSTNRMPET